MKAKVKGYCQFKRLKVGDLFFTVSNELYRKTRKSESGTNCEGAFCGDGLTGGLRTIPDHWTVYPLVEDE